MRKEGDKMSGYGGYEECGGRGKGFALIVVLFILLIIVGAVIFKERECEY
jgi:uncharacterized protein (TIGR01732 family)